MALSNAMQEQSMNAMRERQLFGAEQEKNALRRYLADPTVDLTSPDAARKLLEIAPTTGAATYQALLRGYADKRAAEASVRAGTASSAAAAASSRQAELTNLNIQKANFDLAQRGLVGIANLPDEEKPTAWAAWRAETERAVPWTRGRIPRDYSPAAYRDALLTAQGVADRITAEARPPADYTIGNTRFSGATNQPIAAVEARDTAREVRIRSIMETQNVPLQIAAGIVDGVLVPIQDSVSGQTRLFNLANNTFLEFTPAGAPAPAAPAPMATGPRVGVAPPAPAPMATGPRVGVAPPPNAMVAEPANAMLALPGAAAQPNMVQLPTYAAPTTRPEADYQKRVLDLMADLEKQRIENLRARTARREDAAAIAAEKGAEAEAIARGQSVVRRADQPIRVEEAGQTAGAVAGAQANVRRAEQPARVEEAGQTVSAQETARIQAREAEAKRAEAEKLNTAIRELERITRPNGLLQRSTGSGIGQLVDIAGRFFGGSSRGSEAAAALAPIADVVLKLVPRFEGPQSDKDTATYQAASGRLADPSVPNAERLAAAREIIRLMRDRRDQFSYAAGGATAPTAAPAAAAAPPVPQGLDMTPDNWSRLWGVMTPQERALWQN
jgi:hypothetical protein